MSHVAATTPVEALASAPPSRRGGEAEGATTASTAAFGSAESGTAPWSAEVGTVRLYFGAGELGRLGALARDLGAGPRVLVVTDPGVRATGHVERAERALHAAGLAVAVFDEVEENPTTRHVNAGRRAAAAHRADLLIGLGGGSAMDCAKGINFLYTNGGRMEDYQGFGRASHPMLPSIGIPTTAGTGSDAQSYALIAREEGHAKMACGDVKARFHSVILDPELAASAPRRVVAAAGMDALSHTVESYVSSRRTPISRLYAREAWRLLEANIERVLSDPGDLDAAGAMLLGAHLAGAAVEGSMLGAAHACANPLTAHHGIPHGAAVNLTLPHVVRYNAGMAGDVYRNLAGSADAAAIAARLADLRARAGLPQRLRDCGVDAGHLPDLATEAAAQWTAGFNPRPVTAADLLAIYEAAF
jgi:alcohol dehydrogenase